MDDQGAHIYTTRHYPLNALEQIRNGSTQSTSKGRRTNSMWCHLRRLRLSWIAWRKSTSTWYALCISSQPFSTLSLRRPRIFPNLIMPCLLRIQHVLFVMIQKEKIAMLLYFVTVATSLFIKVFPQLPTTLSYSCVNRLLWSAIHT